MGELLLSVLSALAVRVPVIPLYPVSRRTQVSFARIFMSIFIDNSRPTAQHFDSRASLETLKTGALSVAAFAGFAPFAWREGSEPRGRDIAFLKRFADAHALDLSVEFFDFDRLWELPGQGKVDIAASGISFLPEKRKGTASWSAPYSEVRRSLLIRSGDRERFREMRDLAHSRLAVVACSAAHDHALEMMPDTTSLVYCETLQQGIEDLLRGRVDAVGTGSVSAQHHLASRAGLAAVDVHDCRKPEYISFAVRSSGPLLKTLNTFIATHAGQY